MNSSKYYLGIAIGPIYDTLSRARKTRELWASSYLFSVLMKELVKAAGDLGAGAGCKVLSPVPTSINDPKLYGAGVYPDRLFAEVDSADEGFFESIKAAALTAVIAEVKGAKAYDDYTGIGDNARFQADITSFWNGFFRIAHVFVSRKEMEKEAATNGGTVNILKALNERLDTKELAPVYFYDEPSADGILHLLENPYQTPLARNALKSGTAYSGFVGHSGGLEFFPSTAEIASLELFQRDEDAYRALRDRAQANVRANFREKYNRDFDPDEDDHLDWREFYRILYDEDNGLKQLAQPYHRYFCIVHADGDNFGEVINTLKEKKIEDTDLTVTEFSQKIADFAVTASVTINRFGGKPVYIGGDDLVFFAPVVSRVNRRSQSVFHLLKALDEDFAALNLPANPSMSYGVSIAHYKFPLFEARDLSYAQLDYRAKKVGWANTGKKNSVSFRLLKHSGSYFEGILNKDPLLTSFNKLSNQFMNGTAAPEKADPEPETTPSAARDARGENKPLQLLSSFAFKLRELEELVDQAAKADTGGAISNVFDNYFNEPIHHHYKKEKEQLESFTGQVYRAGGTIKTEEAYIPIDVKDNFYALLRLLDFLTPKTKPDAQNN